MELQWFAQVGKVALFALLSLAPRLGDAQQTEASLIRFTTLSKSTPDGLRTDWIRDLALDMAGYLWIATDQGLSRFDGFRTIHYTADPTNPDGFSSDQLTALATTRRNQGPLWIGTSSMGLMTPCLVDLTQQLGRF